MIHGQSQAVESGCECKMCNKARQLLAEHNYDGMPFMLPTSNLEEYAVQNRREPFDETTKMAWRHMLSKDEIDDSEADWWAVKVIGVHPVLVWPEWFDKCLEMEWDGARQEEMFC